MKKDNLAFLLAGLAFGALLGYGLFNAVQSQPEATPGQTAEQAGLQAPAGPMAPTQVGAAGSDGGAPMMAEINQLKRRLQETPDDLAVVVRLANLYHDVGIWDQAVGYYQQALELRPGNPDLMTDLGTCYRGMKSFDQALEMFEQAHASDASHWQSLFNTVIVAAFDLGDLDRARSALQVMEAMDPQPPKLAELQHMLDRFEEDPGATSAEKPS